ncbi:MAG: insulinase family protein [Gammaproteobacteria bacterium]
MSHPAFEHIRTEHVPTLRLDVDEYRHSATGARHFHLASEDKNNAFLVAFLTVPQDSTGVAHILEHTSLCGSERFPVRDPFFMMTRRSLNTFMNAFTASDWTAYPFASQNRKDFNNLLDVYLDAVFFPRLDPLDFAQEGHRVELENPQDPDSELVFKGVVFNEMKGAMSSPVRRLYQAMSSNLFPTVTYHWNSGGEPENIPDLSYQQLKDFHARHYHPSNAIFMTYGDIPAEEHQAHFEDKALGRFSREDVAFAVPQEQRYPAPRTVETRYALDGDEDTGGKTHVVMGWLLGANTDVRGSMQAHLLNGVLLDNSASPLRHALETTDLAASPSDLCGLDDSTREMTFMCGVEGSEPEHAEAVEDLILGVLQDVAANGVEQGLVESVLHQLELHQREVGGGGFPYGLQLMVNALGPAIHGGDPVAVLNIDGVLEELRESIKDPAYIPGLVRSLLLDNSHRVRLTMVPDTHLSERQTAAEAARLASLKAGLNKESREQIVKLAEALEERQMQQDDPELLPKVTLEDVPDDMPIAEGTQGSVHGQALTRFAQGTNGLVYEQVICELPELSETEVDDLYLFTDLVTELGCGARDYRETQAWQAAVTGGVSARSSIRSSIDDVTRGQGFLVLAGKALVRNAGELAGLMHETFTAARFDELSRIRELVAQSRAYRWSSITDRGHSLAMTAAAARLAPMSALSHRWSGLGGLVTLKNLDQSLKEDAALEALAARLEALRDRLSKAPRRFLAVAEEERLEALERDLSALWSTAGDPSDARFSLPGIEGVTREGWATSSQVSFCSKAYATVPWNHPDSAAFSVLGSFLRNGFLHRSVREQGGAYGGGASWDPDSAAFRFYSYRDPRLADTLDDFDRSIDWLLSTDHEYRALEEAILGVVASIDRPDSPAGEAIGAYFSGLHGRTPELRRAFRKRILDVTLEDLKRVAEQWLRPETAHVAVLSNAKALEAAAARIELDIIQM